MIDVLCDIVYNDKKKGDIMDNSEERKEQFPKFYTPKEVAEMFGITPGALRSRRLRGQIKAIVINDNNVVYTEEQIKNANLSPRKRGPKPKKKESTDNQPDKQVA